MITLSIDVTRLDKSRFKTHTRKDGTKAIFLELVLFPGKNGTDAYGNDGMVKQQVTKEEREARVEMPILGNYRVISTQRPAQPAQTQPPKTPPPIDDHNKAKADGYAPSDRDVPF